MSSTNVINGKFLEDIYILKRKYAKIVTSTPIKTKSIQQLNVEWPSPMNASPIAHSSLHSLVKKEKTEAQCGPVCEDENIERRATSEIPASNNTDVQMNNIETAKLILMDSDEEEEFWRNKNKHIKREKNTKNRNNVPRNKKVKEKAKTVNAVPIVDESRNSDSEVLGILLPKISKNLSKAVHQLGKCLQDEAPPKSPHGRPKNEDILPRTALEIGKKLSRNTSSDKSETPRVAESVKEPDQITNKDDDNVVRRSIRKRCKPLEFWNGEKMEIDRDFTVKIECSSKYEKNVAEKKVKKVQNSKVDSPEIKQHSTLNSSSTHKLETSLLKRSGVQKKNISISKQRTSTRLTRNVRFSAIGTATTIAGPTSKKNINPEWLKNFEPNLISESLPNSEDCVLLPGLNAFMGIISSAVLQLRPKSVNQSLAPELHNLIFCVMEGTVRVTIGEVSVKMKTYGHFAVPSGVAYKIKNMGSQKAVLSFFEIACNGTTT